MEEYRNLQQAGYFPPPTYPNGQPFVFQGPFFGYNNNNYLNGQPDSLFPQDGGETNEFLDSFTQHPVHQTDGHLIATNTQPIIQNLAESNNAPFHNWNPLEEPMLGFAGPTITREQTENFFRSSRELEFESHLRNSNNSNPLSLSAQFTVEDADRSIDELLKDASTLRSSIEQRNMEFNVVEQKVGGFGSNLASDFNISSQIINKFQQDVRKIASMVENLRLEQGRLPLPPPREGIVMLDQEQKKLRSYVDTLTTHTNNLIDSYILDSKDMTTVLELLNELHMLKTQLDLYMNELVELQKQAPVPCACLVISAQPFPDSVKQNRNLDDPITVRLFTGAKGDPNQPGAIRAEVVNQTAGRTRRSAPVALENNEKQMIDGVVVFNDLKFPQGTRLRNVRLKFTGRVNLKDPFGNVHTITIESDPTAPLIVKTNENQWFEAEGILLKTILFESQQEVSWKRFANWLSRRYLRATKQNVTSPMRPLSLYDFDYIHKLKFEQGPIVNVKQLDSFWEWFGPLMHKIKYQRHICSLWTRGLICGFLTREEVEEVLKNEKVGTFLIRFSERVSGQFVVAYTQSAEPAGVRVKHYLVKQDDIMGARKTLPDFLGACKDFSCILQLWTDKDTQKRILRRCDKDSVLREFYTKKTDNTTEGYDEDIIVVP